MARWKVKPGTVNNKLAGVVDYDEHESRWEIQQDVTDILKEVERDREILKMKGKDVGWRKAFTVPDIVAIELLSKYGMDIHAPDFMHDSRNMDKLKSVIKTDYPYLLIST